MPIRFRLRRAQTPKTPPKSSIWTPAAIRCTIAKTRAVPARHAGIPSWEMVAMTHKPHPRVAFCLLLFILTFASTASAEWKEKVLYSFQDVTDGAIPTGAVVFDKTGKLFGATQDGGSSSCDGPGQCGTV
jgi:hypothetical protein